MRENREIIHKIGITGGDVKTRITQAKDDPTFLMADVEIVATYKLSNINRVKLEPLIHKFFDASRLNIEIKDRFGKAITRIKDGTIHDCIYDRETATIRHY